LLTLFWTFKMFGADLGGKKKKKKKKDVIASLFRNRSRMGLEKGSGEGGKRRGTPGRYTATREMRKKPRTVSNNESGGPQKEKVWGKKRRTLEYLGLSAMGVLRGGKET